MQNSGGRHRAHLHIRCKAEHAILYCIALVIGEKESLAAPAIIKSSGAGRTRGSRDPFCLRSCKAAGSKKADLGITLIELKQVMGNRPAARPDGHTSIQHLESIQEPLWEAVLELRY